MDEGEIVRDYLQAKDRKAQIGILAELNLTSKNHILAILARYGLDAKDCILKPEENPEFMRLYRDGLNDTEMAKALEVSHDTVRRWRRRNGLDSNWHHGIGTARKNYRRITEQEEKQLMGLWKSGKNDHQIAKIAGRYPNTIWRWRERNGLPRNCGRGGQEVE